MQKFETPATNENPKQKYARLLNDGLTLNKKLDDYYGVQGLLAGRPEDTAKGKTGKDLLGKNIDKTCQQINKLLKERVELIRTAGFQNIESLYPRVKKQKSDNDELSIFELGIFNQARRKLAEKYGYKISFNVGEDASFSGWVTLTKDNMHFNIKAAAFRDKNNLGGKSRIYKLDASIIQERKKQQQMLEFDRGDFKGIPTKEVQREIDKIVAIFG